MTIIILTLVALIALIYIAYSAYRIGKLRAFLHDTIITSVAIAFLTSAIFYFFAVYLPRRDDLSKINIYAQKQCDLLISDCSHLVDYLSQQAEMPIGYSSITSNQLYLIAERVNPHKPGGIRLVGAGEGYVRDYIDYTRRESKKTMNSLVPYSYILDAELVMWINELLSNDFFTDRFVSGYFYQNLGMFGGNTNLSVAAPVLWQYIESTRAVEDYWKNK